ncbi:MAG: trypsin-like serine protease, partial [Deltaproteobacteria bacterium]
MHNVTRRIISMSHLGPLTRFLHRNAVRCLVALSFAAVCPQCGDAPNVHTDMQAPTTATSQAPLLNGMAVADDEIRQVGALVGFNALGEAVGFCSATLIAPDVLLTAGHCLGPITHLENVAHGASQRKFVFTQAARAFPLGLGNPTPVRHTVVHPAYEDQLYLLPPLLLRFPQNSAEQRLIEEVELQCGYRQDPFHQQEFWRCVMQLPDAMLRDLGYSDKSLQMADIGLAFLDKPLWDTQPVQLPQAPLQVDDGQLLMSVGYGISQYGVWYSSSYAVRRVGPVHVAGIGDYELHIGGDDVRICSGDSGGPLLRQADAYNIEVLGVVSRGGVDRMGHCSNPSLLT